MKKISIYLFLLLSIAAFSQNGGVKIGGSTANHDSAILQIENSSNKGVLLPQVELLDDLTDTTTPIANPINGMVVYNIGNASAHGYYYWDVNTWKLMGDSGNVSTNAVFRNTTAHSILAGKTIGSFQDINNANWFQFSNNITGASATSTGDITLPEGFYIVHINANLTMPILSSTAGVASSDLHLLKLKAKLYNGSTTLYGEETADNGIARATVKKYSTNFDFVFKLTTPTTFKIALATDSGGTYSNGIGGTGANNGQFTLDNITIHIQRSIATP